MCQIETIQVPVDFTSVVCPTCGIMHYVPFRMYLYFRERGQPLHCPGGHATIYHAPLPLPQTVESQQVQALRDQVAKLTHQLDQTLASLGEITDGGLS